MDAGMWDRDYKSEQRKAEKQKAALQEVERRKPEYGSPSALKTSTSSTKSPELRSTQVASPPVSPNLTLPRKSPKLGSLKSAKPETPGSPALALLISPKSPKAPSRDSTHQLSPRSPDIAALNLSSPKYPQRAHLKSPQIDDFRLQGNPPLPPYPALGHILRPANTLQRNFSWPPSLRPHGTELEFGLWIEQLQLQRAGYGAMVLSHSQPLSHLRSPSPCSSRVSIAEKKEGFRTTVRRRWNDFIQKRHRGSDSKRHMNDEKEKPGKEEVIGLDSKKQGLKNHERSNVDANKPSNHQSETSKQHIADDAKKHEADDTTKHTADDTRKHTMDDTKKHIADDTKKNLQNEVVKEKVQANESSKATKKKNVSFSPHELSSSNDADDEHERGRPVFTSDGRLQTTRWRDASDPDTITRQRRGTLSRRKISWQEPEWGLFKVVEEQTPRTEFDDMEGEVRTTRARASTKAIF